MHDAPKLFAKNFIKKNAPGTQNQKYGSQILLQYEMSNKDTLKVAKNDQP